MSLYTSYFSDPPFPTVTFVTNQEVAYLPIIVADIVCLSLTRPPLQPNTVTDRPSHAISRC
jgi:hypothetical protein